MKLPHIIENPNEEYVTLPALRTFARANGIPTPKESESQSANKEAYIKAISAFGDFDPDNSVIVVDWIDSVIKEGIKEIQIVNVSLRPEMELIFSSDSKAEEYFQKLVSVKNQHLAGNEYGNKYDLVKYELSANEHGKYASLLFCRMMQYQDVKKGRGAIVEYPIFADYYYEKGWLIIRYKPRSSLFDYMPEAGLEKLLQHPVSINSEIKSIFSKLDNIFGFENIDEMGASVNMRSKFYEILFRYTQTPPEISEIIEKSQDNILEMTEAVSKICHVPITAQEKVSADIKNMIEKFLSIFWEEKDIFTRNREAYPIRLSSTDEEESKVDQSSVTTEEPLQSKEVFFDNKRMLHNQKRCDGLTLVWKRQDKTYYSSPSFPVRLSEKGGKCTLSFKKYVAEEDIQNVLFAVIDA